MHKNAANGRVELFRLDAYLHSECSFNSHFLSDANWSYFSLGDFHLVNVQTTTIRLFLYFCCCCWLCCWQLVAVVVFAASLHQFVCFFLLLSFKTQTASSEISSVSEQVPWVRGQSHFYRRKGKKKRAATTCAVRTADTRISLGLSSISYSCVFVCLRALQVFGLEFLIALEVIVPVTHADDGNIFLHLFLDSIKSETSAMLLWNFKYDEIEIFSILYSTWYCLQSDITNTNTSWLIHLNH